MRYSALATALAAFLLPICATAHAECKLEQIAELPVTMAGFKPMVPAKINGRDARFIADSGAFFSVITPGSAAENGLRLSPAPSFITIRGIGGSSDVSIATVKGFTLAGVTIPNVQFIVGGSETGGAGLLGQNVLGIADVDYDLGGGAIRIMRARDCGKANLAYWAGSKSVSMMDFGASEAGNRFTIGTVYLNGARLRAIFDTGSSASLLSLSAAARAGVRPGDPGVKDAGPLSGVGRKLVQTWIAPFASFKIGEEEIRNIRLRIGDLGLSNADMLIGADFFLSHRVYVANDLHKIFFTYNGGPVFNLSTRQVQADGKDVDAAPADPAAEPKDADGYSRRGAGFATRQDYPRAIADFSHAVDLAPDNQEYRLQRARMLLANRQPFLAMNDLDKILTASPGNVDALIVRTELRIIGRDMAGAAIDLDAAAKAATPQSDLRIVIGSLYDRIDHPERGIGEFDLWITYHPEDNRVPRALNGRCWARARLDRELDKALADCNRALRLQPKTAQFLDSRALVAFRQGDFVKAIADDDAAIALEPRRALTLYARGIAKIRAGRKDEGAADIAAAVAIRGTIADDAKRFGIAP